MVKTFGQNQPVALEKPHPPQAAAAAAAGPAAAPVPAPAAQPVRPPGHRHRRLLSLFWVGICAAFVWGYWGPSVLAPDSAG